MVFSTIEQAPPDAILGVTEACRRDPHPEKINLAVGVFKDAQGKTPVLQAVKRAEERILRSEDTKGYLSIAGSPEYAKSVRELLFGADHPVVTDNRVFTAHTPGGTGALRVAADFIRQKVPGRKIWMTNPTWPNHPQVFEAAGLETEVFTWFDPATNDLAFKGMKSELLTLPERQVVLLHACCHNPTGVDPTPEQWEEIAEILAEREHLPLIDFAYQGFGDGLEEDARGLRILLSKCPEAIVCSSFSKNFGLYRDRVGALTVVGATPEDVERVGSQLEKVIRANYSNPPAHGGLVVSTIFSDPELSGLWRQEVTAMRERFQAMRGLFVSSLAAEGIDRDFSFIERQRGMFSFSGLTKEQVQVLRNEYAIYIVGSGRINVAGMTEKGMPRLCGAIREVLAGPRG